MKHCYYKGKKETHFRFKNTGYNARTIGLYVFVEYVQRIKSLFIQYKKARNPFTFIQSNLTNVTFNRITGLVSLLYRITGLLIFVKRSCTNFTFKQSNWTNPTSRLISLLYRVNGLT